jgi:hypothetical protein
MDPKQAAHILGGFATEKRVRILKALMSAGEGGLSILELSRVTDTTVADIGSSLESLASLDMINISIVNNERVLVPNRKVLNKIFGEFYERYVVQRKKNSEPTSG